MKTNLAITFYIFLIIDELMSMSMAILNDGCFFIVGTFL